jgi:hypothetical protein
VTLIEAVIRIRQKVRDTSKLKFSDSEVIACVNEAIDFISAQLIQIGDNDIVKEVVVDDGDPFPNDFYKFAGEFPIFNNNGVVDGDDASVFPIKLRYYAYKPHVVSNGDLIPHKRIYDTLLISSACAFLMGDPTVPLTTIRNIIVGGGAVQNAPQ